MLAREARLKKNKDFEQIFKKGKSVKGDFLLLKIVKNKLNKNRFAAIVSQKVSKKAIIRNKIRRRIAEIIRQKEFWAKGTAEPGIAKGKSAARSAQVSE